LAEGAFAFPPYGDVSCYVNRPLESRSASASDALGREGSFFKDGHLVERYVIRREPEAS
jgi:hypothetical protein